MSKKEYKIALFEIMNCMEKVKYVLYLSNQESNGAERRKKCNQKKLFFSFSLSFFFLKQKLQLTYWTNDY